MREYTAAEVKRLFELPPGLLRSLTRAGYVTAAAGGRERSYSFQDLRVLRTASALHAAKISTAKIVAALGNIRATDGTNVWETQSGQYALPLETKRSPSLLALAKGARRPAHIELAEEHYARGHALEDTDLVAARAAYRDALRAHGDHLESRINLGRLLHLAGELDEAEKIYRQARYSSALLSFNLAILLEDLSREVEAIAAYRDALAQDPHLYDAHFNLSRLHERAQQPREALRHLLAYRRYARNSTP